MVLLVLGSTILWFLLAWNCSQPGWNNLIQWELSLPTGLGDGWVIPTQTSLEFQDN